MIGRQAGPVRFSMKDEARNTGGRRFWLEDSKNTLRYQGITFVEGGLLNNDPIYPLIESGDEGISSQLPSQPVDDMSLSNSTPTIADTTSIVSPTDEKPSISRSSSRPQNLSSPPKSPSPDLCTSEITSDYESHIKTTSSLLSLSNNHISSTPPLPQAPIPVMTATEEEEEEIILFTPRSQRRNKPPPADLIQLHWDSPLPLFTEMPRAAVDWTKPPRKKKSRSKRGHRQFKHLVGLEGEDSETLEGEMIVDEASRDYLQNVMGQEGSDDDDGILEEFDGLELREGSIVADETEEEVMETAGEDEEEEDELEDDDEMEQQEIEQEEAEMMKSAAEDMEISESEDSSSDEYESLEEIEDTVPHKPTPGTWLAENSEKVDSDDPNWEDDDIPNDAVSSDDASDSSVDLAKDEQKIANMILDDYNLDGLDLSTSTSYGRSRKSLTRQGNVPELPDGDDQIVEYLQLMWKRDKESKAQRRQEREQARVRGLLGNKSKSQGKKERQASRREELERNNEDNETMNIHSIHDEIRKFWEDEDALQ